MYQVKLKEKSARTNKGWQENYSSNQPFVLKIVIQPFPPSVWIFIWPTTGFPEKAEVGYIEERSSFCFDIGGVQIRWLMSFRVITPLTPQGLINANGYTTEDVAFVGVCMYDFLPEMKIVCYRVILRLLSAAISQQYLCMLWLWMWSWKLHVIQSIGLFTDFELIPTIFQKRSLRREKNL